MSCAPRMSVSGPGAALLRGARRLRRHRDGHRHETGYPSRIVVRDGGACRSKTGAENLRSGKAGPPGSADDLDEMPYSERLLQRRILDRRLGQSCGDVATRWARLRGRRLSALLRRARPRAMGARLRAIGTGPRLDAWLHALAP